MKLGWWERTIAINKAGTPKRQPGTEKTRTIGTTNSHYSIIL